MRQLFWFGATGTAAAATHLLVVLLLVEGGGLPPLRANGGGFLAAFAVSYLGHRHLTFAAPAAPLAQSLPRFFLVACGGFLLNEGLFALLLACTALPYPAALAGVLLAVAAVTFLLSRHWAFARAGQRGP
ncbi:MAG: GtrA family protein [Pseudomonadota bacterium]